MYNVSSMDVRIALILTSFGEDFRLYIINNCVYYENEYMFERTHNMICLAIVLANVEIFRFLRVV